MSRKKACVCPKVAPKATTRGRPKVILAFYVLKASPLSHHSIQSAYTETVIMENQMFPRTINKKNFA